jgi:hypothetical protein
MNPATLDAPVPLRSVMLHCRLKRSAERYGGARELRLHSSNRASRASLS